MTPRAFTRTRAVLACAFLVTVLASPTSPAGGTDGGGPPGVGSPMPRLGSGIGLRGAHTLDQALANLAAAGVSVVRDDVYWHRVERERGVYDFAEQEALLGAVAPHGLDVLAILAYGNPLYSRAGRAAADANSPGIPPFGLGSPHLFPPDDEHHGAFAAFAGEAAGRLGDGVWAWELWNEPNLGWRFWLPRENPAAYGALVRQAAAALRTRTDAPISTGGVFFTAVPPGLPHTSGPDFVDRVLSAEPDLTGLVDAIAWHPYPYPFVAPEVVIPGNASVPGSAEVMRQVAHRHGAGHLEGWVTELGWPTHEPYGVTEERQAAYLVRAVAGLWAQGTDLVVWYTYADGPGARQNQEDAFGLFRHDGEAKPAYGALRTFTEVLGDATLAGDRGRELGLDDGAHALAFARPGSRVTMLWTAPEHELSDYGPLPDTADERIVAVPVRGAVHAVGMTGLPVPVEVRDGTARVPVGVTPVYLIERGAPPAAASRR